MPGRYKSYHEYKDSGTEWLGRVPSHWEIKRLGSFFEERREKVSDKEYEPLSVTMQGIVPQLENAAKTDAGDSRKLVLKNDFVINSRSDRKGSSGISSLNGSVSLISTVLIPRNIEPKFVHHLLRSQPFQEEYYRFGKGIVADLWSTNYSEMKNILIPGLPKDEQLKIANFLGHETVKIDTLIEKQQQLIKLLKEKRQAVISHAVTKGLNPNAKMRDSGVEWLGEVPEHWVVAQLKFNTLEMQTGPFGSQLHAEDYVDDGIPLVNPAHMTEGKIVPDSKVSVDHETWNRLSRHQLFEGDLIFARRGELGRCAVITKGEEGWLCGTGSLKAKLNERLIPEYSYLLITSDGVVSELSLESKGSTMDNLNTETLGRVRLPVPPTVEQKKILSYVKEVSGKYDCLIDKASSAIGLMQERRTALISAAVTGKIDVRNWQAPNG